MLHQLIFFAAVSLLLVYDARSCNGLQIMFLHLVN